jgi:protein-tyrosine-phosphatase
MPVEELPMPRSHAEYLWLAAAMALAPATATDRPTDPVATPVVVFVCEHGSAKSIIAMAYFDRLAEKHGLKVRATARGTAPDPVLAPAAEKGLRRDGFDTQTFRPARLSQKDVEGAARIITFGCSLPNAKSAAGKVTDWQNVPAVSEDYSKARDEIVKRVEKLIGDLAPTEGRRR